MTPLETALTLLLLRKEGPMTKGSLAYRMQATFGKKVDARVYLIGIDSMITAGYVGSFNFHDYQLTPQGEKFIEESRETLKGVYGLIVSSL